jgi:tetratricopeptide (TPR) repeat protein
MSPESFGVFDEELQREPPPEPEAPAVEVAPAPEALPEPKAAVEPAPTPAPQGEPPAAAKRGGAAPRVVGSEPDIPLRPRAAAAAAPKPEKPPAQSDIDLSDVFGDLGMTSAPKSKPAPVNLDEVFGDFRSALSKQAGTHEAGEKLTLAKTYLEMGMKDEAMAALVDAAKVPNHRFEAGSILGRMYLKKDDLPHAAEWLERAAEAPAPTANEGRELLYDLGVVLETMGETARALAVFLELQTDAGDYRDVAARVERLARVQTGG